MLELLTDKLQNVFRRLSSHGVVTEKDLDEALREVRIALLEADVNFKVVREFINGVREQAVGAEILGSLTGPQQVIAIVQRQLVHILGETHSSIRFASQPPTVVMLIGLKGSGKTTTAAKLALHLRKGGSRPLLVAADPHRVAAGEQLQALGRQLNVPVYAGDGAARRRRQGRARGGATPRPPTSSSSTRRATCRSRRRCCRRRRSCTIPSRPTKCSSSSTP